MFFFYKFISFVASYVGPNQTGFPRGFQKCSGGTGIVIPVKKKCHRNGKHRDPEDSCRNRQPRRRPLVVLSRQLVVASPLSALSLCHPLIVLLHQLVVALPLTILSLCHPLVNLSCQLVVASPLLVLSLRPAPPSRPFVTPAGCCVASQCATLSLSRCLVVPPLVVALRQLVGALSSLVILSLHRL
jgi:hypothetical protein